MKNQKKGFTLIELLVVIAIIGLLATLSVVALNNARERARDSRRISDIKQIQIALELYYNAHPTIGYPAGDGDAHDVLGALSPYLNPIPQNPTPDDCDDEAHVGTYVYEKVTNNSYTLNYCLGNDTGGITAGFKTATQSTIAE